MLLEHGARANGMAFDGDTLLMCKYQKSAQTCLANRLTSGCGEGTSSCLMYAIGEDDFDTVHELVKHGANVNAPGRSGASPLAYAMLSGSANYPVRQRIINFLKDSGAHR
jgi:ankyrin repeat protein